MHFHSSHHISLFFHSKFGGSLLVIRRRYYTYRTNYFFCNLLCRAILFIVWDGAPQLHRVAISGVLNCEIWGIPASSIVKGSDGKHVRIYPDISHTKIRPATKVAKAFKWMMLHDRFVAVSQGKIRKPLEGHQGLVVSHTKNSNRTDGGRRKK